MGDVVRAATRERGLDPGEHHGEVARALREEEGPAAIAERSLPLIREAVAEAGDDVDTILVDGLRSPVEVACFERAFGGEFLIVSVEAPFDVRAGRLGERGRDDTDADHEALREREARELGFGMGEVMEAADVVIDNAGDLSTFRDRVARLLESGPAALADDDGVELRGSVGGEGDARDDDPGADRDREDGAAADAADAPADANVASDGAGAGTDG
jgi:dephospho-CoA kinase